MTRIFLRTTDYRLVAVDARAAGRAALQRQDGARVGAEPKYGPDLRVQSQDRQAAAVCVWCPLHGATMGHQASRFRPEYRKTVWKASLTAAGIGDQKSGGLAII